MAISSDAGRGRPDDPFFILARHTLEEVECTGVPNVPRTTDPLVMFTPPNNAEHFLPRQCDLAIEQSRIGLHGCGERWTTP